MTPLDIRSLALFRIAIGLLLISDLAERLRYLELYLVNHRNTPGGLPEFLTNFYVYASDNLVLQQVFLCATMLAATFYLFGFKTRVAAVVTWCLVVLLHLFQPRILNGGDKLLRLFLFWSLFLPIGKSFSLDARKSPLAKGETTDAPLLASLALMIQIACPYIFSALVKLNSHHWLEGWGMYFSFTRDDEAKALGLLIAGLPTIFLKIINYAVLAIELLAPLLMFSTWATDRLRLALVVIFIGFHSGMYLTLDVGRFTFVCTTGMLALIPASVWGGRVPLPEANRIWMRGILDYVVAAGIALMLLWNIETLPRVNGVLPKTVQQFAVAFGLNQGFKMYSGVREEGGWFTMPGLLADNTWVDFFRKGQPELDKERPEIISHTFFSEHWRKLIERTVKLRDYKTMHNLADYYCRTWNSAQPVEKKLMTFNLVFTSQIRFRDGSKSKPSDDHLFTRDCN